jgi:hypothetical protein
MVKKIIAWITKITSGVPDFVVVVNLDSVAGCLFFEIVVVGLTKHLLAHNAGS